MRLSGVRRRTGLIIQLAVFDPVELEGTTVSRASVHNLSIMKSLRLGIGDTITVYKANMIIPQIAENLTGSGNAPVPGVLPCLRWKDGDPPDEQCGDSVLYEQQMQRKAN